MILDCYQCSSCYFEDTEPSTKIAPSTIESRQPKRTFKNVLLVFICIELYDDWQEVKQAAQEFDRLSTLIGKRPIVLCPNVHASVDRAPEKQAVQLIAGLEKVLKDNGHNIYRLSFGYHKQFGMECNGNVASVVGRRFYGSAEKQFLRLLTRLGVCPPESLPADMPTWARTLPARPLKVLGSRQETYDMAQRMLDDELNAPAPGELWTCMLFEGERLPMEDYLSKLREIVEEYHAVKVHRALNLSVPGFSNEARSLFRKYPEAIESGRLRIYNSKVSDLEFLITKTAVLLAFPKKPKRAGAYAGEISFGIYCKDEDFAKNLIQWYETFLVDTRFGPIATQYTLESIISQIEDEKAKDARG